MTPQEAVQGSFAASRDWMGSHVGIVKFILSECEVGNPQNSEADEVILANPDESLRIAEEADAKVRNFRVDLSLALPEALWNRAYGNDLDAAAVKEWLQNALFIDSDHVTVEVGAVVDCDE